MCNINCSRIDIGLITIFFMSLTSYAGISIIAPFFPSEAAKKGVSVSICGAVFSANAVGQFLMNSIAGKILPFIGSRIAFVVALIVLGASNIAFGLLQYVDNYTAYVVLCFVFRITEACGSSLINTTIYMVLIKKCQNNLSLNVAINEASSSIGYAVGPALGSLLYSAGGFKMPFIVLGSVVLINVPISMLFLPNYKDLRRVENNSDEQQCLIGSRRNEKLTYVKLITMPKVVVAATVVFTVALSLGCNAAVLEMYLKQYKVGPKLVGYIFMFFTVPFTVISLIVGHYFTNINEFKCSAFGLLLTIFGYLLMLPSPFYCARGSMVTVDIALFIVGCGIAFAFIPTLPSIMKLIKKVGYIDSVHNSSCVSGLWTSFFSLGLATGPTMGSTIFEHFGAQVLFTVMSALSLMSAITIFLSFLKCCDPPQTPTYIQIDGSNFANNNYSTCT